MRTIRFIFLMIGLPFSSMLYAQDVNADNEFEGVKIGSRNYSRTKTGFFAPSDMSLGLVYDLETLRFSDNGYSTKPLNGGRICYVIHGPLSKKGVLSLELPTSLRVNYVKDTNAGGGYKSLYRWEGGATFGVLLSTGYCFSEKCYVTIGGGVALYWIFEETTLKDYSGSKTKIGNFDDKNILMKEFDVPITFSASFRYKRLGMRINYDIGTINRYKKKFYEQTGLPESYTKKNNHFCVGVQYYFM